MNDPLAREFAALLGATGWSQAEAARKLQITRGAISQIMSGRTRPRASTLNLLRLLARDDGLGSGPVQSSPELREWERKLLAELRGMPSERRQLTLGLIKQMSSGGVAGAGKRRK
jgi:transcriptional regulator with XRE-family HTH domain